MEDIILVVILAVILVGAAWYIYKAKKSGRKCIGCPDSGTCTSCTSCSGCSHGCGQEEK